MHSGGAPRACDSLAVRSIRKSSSLMTHRMTLLITISLTMILQGFPERRLSFIAAKYARTWFLPDVAGRYAFEHTVAGTLEGVLFFCPSFVTKL